MTPAGLLPGIAAAFALLPAQARVATCDAPAGPPLQQLDVEVINTARAERSVNIPANVRVLIEATEKGTDARLELQEPGVTGVRRFDNPLRRWAPQRLLLESGKRRDVGLAIVGLERTHGSVALKVFALDPRLARHCVEGLQAAAAGDAAFARGQMISAGLLEAPAGSADRAYLIASQDYARAMQVLNGAGGFTTAQSQLVYAAAELIGNGAWKRAADAARTARKSFESIGSEYGRDRARFFWARAHAELAQQDAPHSAAAPMYKAAIDELLAVAESHAQRNERYDSAFALAFAAKVLYYAEDYQQALRMNRRVLAAFEGQDEPARRAQANQNIAVSALELARYPEALAHFSEALRGLDARTEPEVYGNTLVNVAFTEYLLGRHDVALRHYSEALALAMRTQVVDDQARALHGIGITYEAIGNYPDALAYLDRALALRPVERDRTGRIASLRGSAEVLRDTGRLAESIARRQEALRLSQSPSQRARIGVDIARDQIDSGAAAPARKALDALLADEKLTDPVIRMRAVLERARTETLARELDAAIHDAREAREFFHEKEMVPAEFRATLVQARATCARGDRAGALAVAEQAMTRAEDIRVSSNNPTLRAALWRPLRPAFGFAIGVLANADSCGSHAPADPTAALAIAEKSRNRALEDFRQQALASERSRAGSMSARPRELFEQVAAHRQQIETLSERLPAADSRLQLLRAETANLLREIDLLGGEVAVPAVHTVDLDLSLRAAIGTIPADVAVVEYWTGEEQTFAWLITRGRTKLIDLGSTALIETAARAVHGAMRGLTSVGQEVRLHRLRELHALIVGPLQAELAGARTVIFVPDGTLHTVPFAALASGSGTQLRFLIDSHDVAVAPSIMAAAGKIPRSIGRIRTALVVADPVYATKDSRFGALTASADAIPDGPSTLRGGRNWARLPGAAREASAIVKLLPAGAVDVLSGFDASRDGLLDRDLQGYQIVHFAGHAVADTEAPQLSALILSTVDAAGKPRVGEVFAGDLLTHRMNADLVVLSACDTALGQATAGEGLLGMRYAAHAVGARTVVASLWPVVDAAGARLMDGLYEGVVRRHMTPVAALSQSMRAVRREWPDPALWAVFDVSRGIDR
ncbi:MAG: CHAT domain-containing tetratricopeptide repeat protein [Pseudomonadota bacterium]